MEEEKELLRATDLEAMEAIASGLTPLRVEIAVKTNNRTMVAREHGHATGIVRRLAVRWGIKGRNLF